MFHNDYCFSGIMKRKGDKRNNQKCSRKSHSSGPGILGPPKQRTTKCVHMFNIFVAVNLALPCGMPIHIAKSLCNRSSKLDYMCLYEFIAFLNSYRNVDRHYSADIIILQKNYFKRKKTCRPSTSVLGR